MGYTRFVNTLLKQIAITITLIALTAMSIGVSGLFFGWGLPKSLNILISGITGLIISSSFYLTIDFKGMVVRLIQISIMILLIVTGTNMDIDQLFYFSLAFNLLWILTLLMLNSNRSKYSYLLLLTLAVITLFGLFIGFNSIIYIATSTILLFSIIDFSIYLFNQSK